MKNSKIFILLSLLVVCLLFVCACQKETPAGTEPTPAEVTSEETPGGGTETGGKTWKVAMIMPGRVNDVSWNAAGYQGLEKAKEELGIETAYSENVQVPDAETAMRDYADQGYDLILAHSFNYGDAAKKVAKDYPDIRFAWATGDAPADNVSIYDWPAHQAGYLVGMLAAGMSKTGKIGATGGFAVPDVVRALEGYKLGAQKVNPDIEVFITYLNEWDDVAKGKEAVLAQIEQGADVVYCNGDGISIGCIEACKEKGVYAIGGIADQSAAGSELVLTSTVLNVGASIGGMIKDLEAGDFKEEYLYDMVQGGVDIAPYHDLEDKIPDDVKKLVAETREKILNGEEVVPDIVKPSK